MSFRNIFKKHNPNPDQPSKRSSIVQLFNLNFKSSKNYKYDVKSRSPMSISSPVSHNINLDKLDLVSISQVEEDEEETELSEQLLKDGTFMELNTNILNEEVLTDNDCIQNTSQTNIKVKHSGNVSLTEEILSCNTTKDLDQTSKLDITTYTNLTVDAANVQIFHQPSTLKYINQAYNHDNLQKQLDNNIEPLNATILTNDYRNPNRFSSSTVQNTILENEIDFRLEYNVLLKYHHQAIEKQKSETEMIQRLLTQQKQLNKQLILALTTKMSSKSNYTYRKSFIPIKISQPISSPQTNSNNSSSPLRQFNLTSPSQSPNLHLSPSFESDDLELPESYQELRPLMPLQSAPGSPIAHYQKKQIEATNQYSFIAPGVSNSNSPSSSNASLKEDGFDIFTIDSKSNPENTSTEESVLDDFKFGSSTLSTPDSFSWFDKCPNYDKNYTSIPLHNDF